MIEVDAIATAGLDGFGQVPGMFGRQRLGFQAAGVESPLQQRVVSVAAPADDSPWLGRRANDSGAQRLTHLRWDRTERLTGVQLTREVTRPPE